MRKIVKETRPMTNLDRHVRGATAFTLLELLAVCGVLAAAALVLAPSLAETRQGVKSLHCLNNARQLIVAWQMYSEDSRGALVLSGAGISPQDSGAVYCWANGFMDWSTDSQNTNIVYLTGSMYSRLTRYHNRSASIYSCPADTFVSPQQRALGWVRRARSFCLNGAVGNSNSPPSDAMYRGIKRLSDLQFPTAAETFVFADMHPDGFFGPAFWPPNRETWWDLPSNLHEGSGTFSFADGRGELHKWSGTLTTGRPKVVATEMILYAERKQIPALNDPDRRWVSYRTPRVSPDLY